MSRNSAITQTDYPFVDIPLDIIAWTNVNQEILRLYKQSCRLKAFILAVCTEGSIKVAINLINKEIKKGDVITLLPGSIIQFFEQNDKVNLSFVGFSSHCISGIPLYEILKSSYKDILQYPVISSSVKSQEYLADYMKLLEKLTTQDYTPSSQLAQQILRTTLCSIEEVYKKYNSDNEPQKGRKEELCMELAQLILEHYNKERKVQFYATELGVSIQHLCSTVKEITGKNVSDLISNAIITDITAKLKSTNMSIKEIAYSLNFPNTSFFGKYFKRCTGMSPLEYRNS